MLTKVKIAILDASSKSTNRRLNVLKDVSCKPGCSSCCSRMVYLSVAEASVIQDYLVNSRKWEEVKANCKKLVQLAKDTDHESWFKMNIPCPILKNKLCMAYEVRPPSCSIHYVESDPRSCDPWSTYSGEYRKTNMGSIYEDFSKKLDNAISGSGIFSLIFPLPISLLFAEKIREHPNMSYDKLLSIISSEKQ